MSLYDLDTHLRAHLVTTIADPEAPTLAELAAGPDITPDLAPEGLLIERTDVTTPSSRFRGDLETDAPVRWRTTASLVAWRRTTGSTLWTAAGTFGASTHLVVRRGLLHVVPFAAGDEVEVLRVRFGKRRTLRGPGRTAVVVLPLHVLLDIDDAEVVA